MKNEHQAEKLDDLYPILPIFLAFIYIFKCAVSADIIISPLISQMQHIKLQLWIQYPSNEILLIQVSMYFRFSPMQFWALADQGEFYLTPCADLT